MDNVRMFGHITHVLTRAMCRVFVCTEHCHPQPRAWLLTCDSGDWTRVCTRRDYTNCHKLHEIDPISIFSASMHMLSLT